MNNDVFNVKGTFSKNLGTQLFSQITTSFTPLNSGHLSREVSPTIPHTCTHSHTHIHTHTYIHTPLKHTHRASPFTNPLPYSTVFREMSLPYVVLHTFVFLFVLSICPPFLHRIISCMRARTRFILCGALSVISTPSNIPGTQQTLSKYLWNECTLYAQNQSARSSLHQEQHQNQ